MARKLSTGTAGARMTCSWYAAAFKRLPPPPLQQVATAANGEATPFPVIIAPYHPKLKGLFAFTAVVFCRHAGRSIPFLFVEFQCLQCLHLFYFRKREIHCVAGKPLVLLWRPAAGGTVYAHRRQPDGGAGRHR